MAVIRGIVLRALVATNRSSFADPHTRLTQRKQDDGQSAFSFLDLTSTYECSMTLSQKAMSKLALLVLAMIATYPHIAQAGVLVQTRNTRVEVNSDGAAPAQATPTTPDDLYLPAIRPNVLPPKKPVPPLAPQVPVYREGATIQCTESQISASSRGGRVSQQQTTTVCR